VERGPRGGTTWAGPSAGVISAVYLPPGTSPTRRVSVVYLLTPSGAAPDLAHTLGLAHVADQLIWQRTTVPFVVVVVRSGNALALAAAVGSARAQLPVRRDRNGSVIMTIGSGRSLARRLRGKAMRTFGTAVAIGVSATDPALAGKQAVVGQRAGVRVILAIRQTTRGTPSGGWPSRTPATHPLPEVVRTPCRAAGGVALWHRELFAALAAALAPSGAARASARATGALPSSFARIAVGPAGGTIWQGVIPGGRWRNGPRPSLIYLPPGIDRNRRYPVVYLLHGIRGAPYSFPGGLRLTAVADHLIASHRTRPFIAVMPPAGADPSFRGEWTGSWETYVVRSVVRYADRALPTEPRPEDRSIAGLSAGGYGAVDIALRHPGVFGTVEAWSGYFTAPHDGSLAHADARALDAHDPAMLAHGQARSLRAAAVRFYLTAGARDREALTPTRRFARELTRLGLRPTLVITPGGHTTSSWRAGLPGALSFAVGRPPAIVPARRAPPH
jgi:enterochelin esterase-like enzyme